MSLNKETELILSLLTLWVKLLNAFFMIPTLQLSVRSHLCFELPFTSILQLMFMSKQLLKKSSTFHSIPDIQSTVLDKKETLLYLKLEQSCFLLSFFYYY